MKDDNTSQNIFHFGKSGHCGGNDSSDDTQRLILQGRIDDASGKILESLYNASKFDQAATNDVSRDVLKGFCDTASDINNHTRDLVIGSNNDIQDRVDRVGNSLEGHFRESRTNEMANFNDIRSLIERNNTTQLLSSKDNAMELLKVKCDIEKNIEQTKLETIKAKYDLDKSIEHTKLEVLKAKCELEKGIEQTKLETLKAKGSIKKQNEKNANALKLDILETRCKLEDEIEECCCELKERIENDGDRTRSLIGRIEVEDLRAKLANANAVLISLGHDPVAIAQRQ